MHGYMVALPRSFDDKAEVWKGVLDVVKDAMAFAHIDLIPDDAQLTARGVPERVHRALESLSNAAARDTALSVPASSGPPPLGRHIELGDPTTLEALQVYGPYSINVEIWRREDRELLLGQNRPRPHPLVEQLDSMDALILSLDETEVEHIQEWASRCGVRVVPIDR